MDEPAGYEINSLDMETSWEYIFQNRDILLRLDQFGPVNAQLRPRGIFCCLRGRRTINFLNG